MDDNNKIFKHYAEVYGLWARGYKQEEIAAMLKMGRPAVARKLQRLKQRFPHLFSEQPAPKVYRYDPKRDDGQIRQQF